MTLFLDRADSIARITCFLTQDFPSKRVLMVCGRTGVGKTEVVKKAVGKHQKWSYLGIDCAPQTAACLPRLPLLDILISQIDRQAVAEGFKTRHQAEERILDSLRATAEASLNVAAKVSRVVAGIKELKDRILPTPIQNESSKHIDFLYVKQVLSENYCVIHVDHAVGCAAEDWKVVYSILGATKCVLIIELPETGGSFSFPQETLVKMYVPPLEMVYADAIFGTLPTGLKEQLRCDFVTSGNLKPYRDLFARRDNITESFFGRDITDSVIRFAKAAFECLHGTDLDGLIAISAHPGDGIGIGLLKKYFETTCIPPLLTVDILALIGRLERAVLVIRTSYEIRVPDVVQQIIDENERYRLIQLTAKKAWRDFYNSAPGFGVFIPNEQRWLQILKLSVSLRDSVGIASTLEEIGILHQDAGGRIDSVGFVRRLISSADFDQEPVVIVALARYLYSAGWFGDALDTLSAIGVKALRKDLYLQAELYSASGMPNRGIRLAEHYKETLLASNDTNAELCLELIILHGLRLTNRLKEARQRYKNLIYHRRFADCKAFPTMLRFADLCLHEDDDFEACVSHLESAVTMASTRGDFQEVVSALNSLVQQYGYHDLARASTYLNQAIDLIKDRWCQVATISNNLSVLEFYNNCFGSVTRSRLEDALLLSGDLLDLYLIHNNILVGAMMAGERPRSETFDELTRCAEGDAELDTEIRRIASYNLDQAYSQLGENFLSSKFSKIWRSLESGIDVEYWRCRNEGCLSSKVPSWRLKMSFHPVYLSHWRIGLTPFDAISD